MWVAWVGVGGGDVMMTSASGGGIGKTRVDLVWVREKELGGIWGV